MKEIKDSCPAFSEPYLHNPNLSLSLKSGMSKRFWTATVLMSGVLSDPQVVCNDGESIVRLVNMCYRITDELIKQENE